MTSNNADFDQRDTVIMARPKTRWGEEVDFKMELRRRGRILWDGPQSESQLIEIGTDQLLMHRGLPIAARSGQEQWHKAMLQRVNPTPLLVIGDADGGLTNPALYFDPSPPLPDEAPMSPEAIAELGREALNSVHYWTPEQAVVHTAGTWLKCHWSFPKSMSERLYDPLQPVDERITYLGVIHDCWWSAPLDLRPVWERTATGASIIAATGGRFHQSFKAWYGQFEDLGEPEEVIPFLYPGLPQVHHLFRWTLQP